MLTFQYFLWSVSSRPYRKDGLFCWYKSATVWKSCTSWTNSKLLKEFAQQQVKSCAAFVFSEDLPQHFLWVLHCFDIFRTVLDMVFKVNILPIYALLVQARPFPFPWRCQSDIRYEYLKWSELLNRKDLRFETMPTVCWHEQKQIQFSSNKHKLMVQGSLINIKINLNSSRMHGFGWKIACETINFINMA